MEEIYLALRNKRNYVIPRRLYTAYIIYVYINPAVADLHQLNLSIFFLYFFPSFFLFSFTSQIIISHALSTPPLNRLGQKMTASIDSLED